MPGRLAGSTNFDSIEASAKTDRRRSSVESDATSKPRWAMIGQFIYPPHSLTNRHVTLPSRIPWWRWGGLGLPRTLGEVKRLHVLVLLAVGLTIWCYVDIHHRGQIASGNVDWHMTDFSVYTEAGAAFFDGRDPYRVMNPRGWKYLYPPLLALMVAPLAWLDSQTQVCVWFFVCALLAIGCCREVGVLWRTVTSTGEGSGNATNPGRVWGLWLGLGALVAVLPSMFHDLQRGQVGLLLLYTLLVGVRLVLGDRSAWHGFLGGFVLAFPVVIKLYPIVPVGFFVWQRWMAVLVLGCRQQRLRGALGVSAGVLTGTVCLLLAIPTAVIGWSENLRCLDTWKAQVLLRKDRGSFGGVHESSFHNQSFQNASYWLRVSWLDERPDSQWGAAARQPNDPIVRAATWAVRGMALMLLVVTGVALVAVDERVGSVAGFSLACSVPLIISPIAWTHYYSILLPALCFLPCWMMRQGLRTSAVLAVLGPGILLWLHYSCQSWAGPLGLLGVGITVWYLAVGLRIVLASAAATVRVQATATAVSL
jgi:hypothetical protein